MIIFSSWFLNLPEEHLVPTNSGMPRRKSYDSDILGINLNTVKEVSYDKNIVSFRVISELYDDITAASPVSSPVYDLFRCFMWSSKHKIEKNSWQ